jgi:triosephosphate isomerase (TIM)
LASSKLPQLVVNFKAYPQTLGQKAVALAKAARKLEERSGVVVAVAPQALDLRACIATGARVYAQHFDKVLKPEATGWQSIASLKDAGCEGVLINHSEHRIDPKDVPWFVEAAKNANLVLILCTKDASESASYAKAGPQVVAVEPPELIGGDISAVAKAASGVQVLCGAGVKGGGDVARAIELGAYGILVASGVTKAPRPAEVLADLASGFPSTWARSSRRR